ncbi:MAG: DinB family protein, partial [Burkholderiales bacterium]|nr:DinB family protein [Burkholderiales bacterium]
VEHIWHLADVEQFGWAQRFTRLAAETDPVLPGVDGDRLAIERRYQQRPWRGAARRFIAQRRCTLRALARFDATALSTRGAVFSGEQSDGARMLAALIAHDHEHRLEMADLWRLRR